MWYPERFFRKPHSPFMNIQGKNLKFVKCRIVNIQSSKTRLFWALYLDRIPHLPNLIQHGLAGFILWCGEMRLARVFRCTALIELLPLVEYHPTLCAWLYPVCTTRPRMTNPFVKRQAFGCLVWPTSRAVFFILAEKASFHLSEFSGKRLQCSVQEASLNERLNGVLESQMALLISVAVGWNALRKKLGFSSWINIKISFPSTIWNKTLIKKLPARGLINQFWNNVHFLSDFEGMALIFMNIMQGICLYKYVWTILQEVLEEQIPFSTHNLNFLACHYKNWGGSKTCILQTGFPF